MKFAEVAYYLLIIGVIGFMMFTIYYIMENKQAFTENPFVYGAKKLGNIECSCYQKQNGINVPFSFNDSGFHQVQLVVTTQDRYFLNDSEFDYMSDFFNQTGKDT